MKQPCLMGIDIGTQSTRAALIDLDGHLLTSASSSIEMHTPRPGWAEQDPEIWWNTTIKNIQKIFSEGKFSPDQVISIGVSGQMHGTVPLSTSGELIAHGVQLWCDKRPAELVEQFASRPETREAYQIAGNPPVASWLGFKILWEKVYRPEIYSNTWKFLLPKDYINFQLTGVPTTDYSEASGAFLMDAQTGDWSDELVGLLGLDRSKLPEITTASQVVGQVTSKAASLTGLRKGTLVVAGGGDMLCMLLAAGITRMGVASDVTGTSGIFSVFTPEPVLDPRLMNLHHVMKGWIPFGIIDSGGGALKWFKDSFCHAEIAKANKVGSEVYDILNMLAAEVEDGSEGLLFFPYLMGERTLGTPYARGVFFGLTPRAGKGAMVRAIMEGITFELRRTLEIIEDAGHRVDVIYHNGGGANSDLWNQIKANIYQKKIKTFQNAEGGILGSAILAGVGAGVYSDPGSGAEKCLRVAKTFFPQPETQERYNLLFDVFKDIHDRMQNPYARLAEIIL
jgi:xylulokinase